jgi:hypothetical protein
VTLDENIIGAESGTVTSVNLFVRDGSTWRVVGHHGTAVVIGNHPREA